MALGALSGPRLEPLKGPASHLVVLCHGYGADGNDLIGLAPHWQRELPGAAFVATATRSVTNSLSAGLASFRPNRASFVLISSAIS